MFIYGTFIFLVEGPLNYAFHPLFTMSCWDFYVIHTWWDSLTKLWWIKCKRNGMKWNNWFYSILNYAYSLLSGSNPLSSSPMVSPSSHLILIPLWGYWFFDIYFFLFLLNTSNTPQNNFLLPILLNTEVAPEGNLMIRPILFLRNLGDFMALVILITWLDRSKLMVPNPNEQRFLILPLNDLCRWYLADAPGLLSAYESNSTAGIGGHDYVPIYRET